MTLQKWPNVWLWRPDDFKDSLWAGNSVALRNPSNNGRPRAIARHVVNVVTGLATKSAAWLHQPIRPALLAKAMERLGQRIPARASHLTMAKEEQKEWWPFLNLVDINGRWPLTTFMKPKRTSPMKRSMAPHSLLWWLSQSRMRYPPVCSQSMAALCTPLTTTSSSTRHAREHVVAKLGLMNGRTMHPLFI